MESIGLETAQMAKFASRLVLDNVPPGAGPGSRLQGTQVCNERFCYV